MSQNISQEEKIDYIYATLKKNQKKALFGTIFKWGFYIFMLGYLYYFITIGLPTMIKSFVPEMPTFGSESSVNVDQIKDLFGDYLN